MLLLAKIFMQSSNNLKINILKTVCYADVFDYPLTLEEIHKWLIAENSKQPISLKKIKNIINNIAFIKQDGSYFFLKPKKNVVNLRKQRQIYSQKKLKIANRVGKWIKIFPTVKAVAVTGALAMNNAKKEDDIDLMVITSTNRLWLTRILITPLISIIAKRRRPTQHRIQTTNYKDSICVNLWLDETTLQITKDKQNLYTAHEVAQAKFLWSRNKIDEEFLTKNSWINKYLPNIKIHKNQETRIKKQVNILFSIFYLLLDVIEYTAHKIQLSYMKSKKTREIITPHSAFFHPRDTGNLVLKKYHNLLNRYTS